MNLWMRQSNPFTLSWWMNHRFSFPHCTAYTCQAGPQGNNPADMLNAQAALMGAENDRIDLGMKQKQLEVDDKDITIDGQNRAAERDSREKLAMVNLQRDAMKMDHDKQMKQADMEKLAMQSALKPKPGLLG